MNEKKFEPISERYLEKNLNPKKFSLFFSNKEYFIFQKIIFIFRFKSSTFLSLKNFNGPILKLEFYNIKNARSNPPSDQQGYILKLFFRGEL